MMKNKVSSIVDYAFSPNEALLLDANIWLELFPAPSDPRLFSTSPYRDAFKNILKAKSALMMNVLVISEYLNRYARIEYVGMYDKKYSSFKQFRKSPDFISTGQCAGTFVRKILKFAPLCNNDYTLIDIDSVISNFESGESDFNDGILAENCRINNWKLVTNDGDFKTSGIEIITANTKLLKACS